MRQRWCCWLLQLLPGVIPHNTVIQYNGIQHNIGVIQYNIIPHNIGVIQYNTVVILHNVILHNISVIQYNTVTDQSVKYLFLWLFIELKHRSYKMHIDITGSCQQGSQPSK